MINKEKRRRVLSFNDKEYIIQEGELVFFDDAVKDAF